jgi:hypothetical protein
VHGGWPELIELSVKGSHKSRSESKTHAKPDHTLSMASNPIFSIILGTRMWTDPRMPVPMLDGLPPPR